MKNPLVVYALVAVVSFLVLFTVLFLIFRPKGQPASKVAAVEKPAVPAESTLTIGDSLLAQPDSVNALNDRAKLQDLKKRILDIYDDKSLHKRPDAEIDKILKELVAQIDSIESNQGAYQRYIAYQNQKMNTLRDSLNISRQNISTLERTVAGMKAQKQPGVPSIKSQEPVIKPGKGLQELANTYNSMKAERVAELLSTMQDQQAIEILRKMNERKRAKVLEVMPLARASSLVAKLVTQ